MRDVRFNPRQPRSRSYRNRANLCRKEIRTNKEHLLLFGGTGSGKGTRILMPNLLDISGSRSIVVIDPKGELAAVTAKFRREVSDVVILNPFGVLTEYYADMRGVGFNPLATLNPESEDFNVDASLLAEAMITIDSKTQPHFDHSARALASAIIMHVTIEARRTGEAPTMEKVRELLCLSSKALPLLAEEMTRSGCIGLRNKAAQFTHWNNEIAAVASTAKVQTECFDDPQIAKNMARNDFDFSDLKRKPTTVYLVLPPHMLERHGKWLRLLLTSALRASMRPREAGEPSILFMLDEFAALGHMRIVETMWAQVRGYGIQMMPVFQDLLQLKDIYKDRWESFVANAGALLFFRPNDITTAEWLSKRLGETTRMLQTMNELESQSGGENSGKSVSSTGESQSGGANSGWSLSRSLNSSFVKVAMTLPHELYGLKEGEMRAFLTGVKNGLTLKAPAYFEIESRDLRARPNPYFRK